MLSGRRASWSVVCDFDGTVSEQDVTDSLLLRFARPGWQELEAQWEAGRIGSRACMAGQVALLDCTKEELDAHVAGSAIDPGFRSFVEAVDAEGASLTIASDGFGEVIAAMLARAGLAHLPVRASRLVQAGPRRWALEFPHARTACTSASATCKCACVCSDAARGALLVGDGASDFCAATRADLTFAKSRLLDRCVMLGLPHRPIRGFADALVAWRELADDGIEAAALSSAGAA
jgi:2-hydroxy-3-keto-5-methylthiopentenyl-1-phosphate phosphatase